MEGFEGHWCLEHVPMWSHPHPNPLPKGEGDLDSFGAGGHDDPALADSRIGPTRDSRGCGGSRPSLFRERDMLPDHSSMPVAAGTPRYENEAWSLEVFGCHGRHPSPLDSGFRRNDEAGAGGIQAYLRPRNTIFVPIAHAGCRRHTKV